MNKTKNHEINVLWIESQALSFTHPTKLKLPFAMQGLSYFSHLHLPIKI